MATKLTDIQRVILAAAAAREGGCVLPIPDSLTLSAGTGALVLKGLVAKVLLTATDDEPTALVISPAGLEAIGVEPDSTPVQPEAVAEAPKPRRRAKSRAVRERAADRSRTSKQDVVVALLRRGEGASVGEIMAATNWQAHSVRGFLTASVKGRMKLPLVSEKTGNGERRYYVAVLQPSEG